MRITMKVGIISINKYSKHLNFGAALHSYAFQQYLDKQGIDNVIIDYLPRFMKTYNMKYPFLSEQPKEKIKRFFEQMKIIVNVKKQSDKTLLLAEITSQK